MSLVSLFYAGNVVTIPTRPTRIRTVSVRFFRSTALHTTAAEYVEHAFTILTKNESGRGSGESIETSQNPKLKSSKNFVFFRERKKVLIVARVALSSANHKRKHSGKSKILFSGVSMLGRGIR